MVCMLLFRLCNLRECTTGMVVLTYVFHTVRVFLYLCCCSVLARFTGGYFVHGCLFTCAPSLRLTRKLFVQYSLYSCSSSTLIRRHPCLRLGLAALLWKCSSPFSASNCRSTGKIQTGLTFLEVAPRSVAATLFGNSSECQDSFFLQNMIFGPG